MPRHVEFTRDLMAALGLEGQPLQRLVIEADVRNGVHFYVKGVMRYEERGRLAALVTAVEDVAVSPDGVVSVTPLPPEGL